jgi:hypothetical protein
MMVYANRVHGVGMFGVKVSFVFNGERTSITTAAFKTREEADARGQFLLRDLLSKGFTITGYKRIRFNP